VIVAVTAVGTVDPAVLAKAENCLADQFGAASLHARIAEPDGAFDAARRQYNSTLFLRALAAQVRDGGKRVLGITERDLFIPMLTFVFGQAQLEGVIALVSTARLRQEFYSLPPDPELLSARLHKEVAHEMGHTLGLVHCPDKSCVMSLSTAILHVDRKQARFCVSCRQLLDERMARMESNEATLANSGSR
jgi:archaemetzincin